MTDIRIPTPALTVHTDEVHSVNRAPIFVVWVKAGDWPIITRVFSAYPEDIGEEVIVDGVLRVVKETQYALEDAVDTTLRDLGAKLTRLLEGLDS